MSCELGLDLGAHGVGNALWPALERAGLGELAKMRGGRFAGGHQLVRILVAQLVQREMRQRGDLHRLGQQLRWIEPRQAPAFAQVAFAVGVEALTGLGHGDAMPHGRERILEPATLAHVHVHVAGRGEWQLVRLAQSPRHGQPFAIPAIARELDRNPGAAGEMRAQPQRLRIFAQRASTQLGQPEHQRALGHAFAGIVHTGPGIAASARNSSTSTRFSE